MKAVAMLPVSSDDRYFSECSWLGAISGRNSGSMSVVVHATASKATVIVEIGVSCCV
jgi:hypothetical protein